MPAHPWKKERGTGGGGGGGGSTRVSYRFHNSSRVQRGWTDENMPLLRGELARINREI